MKKKNCRRNVEENRKKKKNCKKRIRKIKKNKIKQNIQKTTKQKFRETDIYQLQYRKISKKSEKEK